MAKVISIRISDAMYTALRRQARARGLRPSAAARDLVRRGLALATPSESLTEEARIAARADLLAAINDSSTE